MNSYTFESYTKQQSLSFQFKADPKSGLSDMTLLILRKLSNGLWRYLEIYDDESITIHQRVGTTKHIFRTYGVNPEYPNYEIYKMEVGRDMVNGWSESLHDSGLIVKENGVFRLFTKKEYEQMYSL